MKDLFTCFSNLLSLSLGSQSSEVGFDCRLTVGSPSGLDAKWKQNPFMRFAVVLTIIFTIGVGNAWAQTTYHLTAVTSVSAGNMYVLVENGNALDGTISSSKLQSTTSFNTTGLSGSETYIWTLESATGGYYLKKVSAGASGYLRNSSKANLALSTSDQSNNVWTFSFGVSTAEINVGERKLAETGSGTAEYKAYVDIPSGAGYSFTVYRLDVDVTTTHTVTWNDNSGQLKSESIAEGSTTYSCPASNPSTSAPNCGDKFMGWTNTTNYVHGISPLFTDDSGSKPAINADTDFYAVFADEE